MSPLWIAVHLPCADPDTPTPHWQTKAAIQHAAGALLQYTPEVAAAAHDSLLLDVTASLNLFGGARALRRRVRATLHALPATARTAMAPTACGAWLLACANPAPGCHVLKIDSLIRRLDALPCTALPAAQPYLDWLTGIGCTTLGALRKLPRAGLQRRTNPSIVQTLDAAYGQAPELHRWLAPTPVFSQRIELAQHIEHAQAAQYIVQKLIAQLCDWLSTCMHAVTRLAIFLEHERGRHACPPTVIELRTSVPAWQAEHLTRLARERLQRTHLQAAIIAIGLDTLDTQAREDAPTMLFSEPGGSAADRRQVLEVLIARLGRDQVLHPSPIADHRPEVANRWVPLDEPASQSRFPKGLERPFWLLDEPITLPVRGHRPFYGAPLRIVRGPERIEDGWWSGLTLRDYFVAEAPDGARYWLFQDRSQGGAWFLHGLFG